MYIDNCNRKLNRHRISVKLGHAQRLLDDVLNASSDLNIKGPIEELVFNGEDILKDGECSAKSIILESICLKDDLIQECLFEAQQCIKDILSELK
jgi:hypothetical protein